MANAVHTHDVTPAHAVTLEDVRRAAEAIAGAVVRTPQSRSRTLSRIAGADVFLKFETFQFTAAFKERGALNKLLALSPEQRAAGVAAVSAGNHAQAVAYHAQRLGIAATIVMPANTPFVKVRHTRAFGADVVLHGADLAEADLEAHRLVDQRGLVFIPPYDDPAVIAGQGTIALEMLADRPDLDILAVPVGGGGMIAGMAAAAKAIKPDIKVIGVEAALFPAMRNSLTGDDLPCGGTTIAEGIAVARVGDLTSRLARDLVDEVLLVDETQIEEALCLLLAVEKTLTEGAGAAGLAALLAYPGRFAGKRVGLVLCGGNIDQRLLSSVLMRDLVRQGRMARLRIPIPDSPGELSRVTAIIGEGGGNIVEVSHQRTFANLPAKLATADFAIETRDASQMNEIRDLVKAAGYRAELVDVEV